MTVAELIAALQQMPADKPVTVVAIRDPELPLEYLDVIVEHDTRENQVCIVGINPIG